MKLERVYDRKQLAAYFRKNLPLHAYALGDLDDFFWPRTACYGRKASEGISRVVVIYSGPGLPVLLALGENDLLENQYFDQLQNLLPNEFYAHLSPGFEKWFAPQYSLQEFGSHCKMALDQRCWPGNTSTSGTFQLQEKHLPEIRNLYQQSYPDNAFDLRMLKTGKFYGIRDQGQLVSIAGLHVYSPEYRVAALGNIATQPEYRNQGYARKVTARLCQDLLREVDFIGLNVKCDNQTAIGLYRSLGFRIGPRYAEFALKRRF